jgi:hypothetical protein
LGREGLTGTSSCLKEKLPILLILSPINTRPIPITIKVVAFLVKKLEGLKVRKVESSKVERVSGCGQFCGLKPKECGNSSLYPTI